MSKRLFSMMFMLMQYDMLEYNRKDMHDRIE